MSDSHEVSAEQFREWMAPTVEALTGLARAVEAIGPRHGNLPTAESEAMRELAAEGEYRARSGGWEHPMTDTHTFGRTALWAGADCVRTFAAAFAGAARPPLYGHLVLARTALEASVVASWLNEPGVGHDERVKRGLCEVLYNAREVRRLGLSSDADALLTQAEEWVEHFGWAATFPYGKPDISGTKRRSVGDGITRLVVEDPDALIGRAQWSRLSAVNHVTWWGLAWAFDLSGADAGDSGFATVPVGTDSSKVALQAFCIHKAIRVAATERVKLMGWDDDEWREACRAAEEHEEVLRGLVVQSADP
jgi:hypothetical protein